MYEATIDNTLLFQTTTGRGDLRSQFLSADGNTLIADSEIYGPIFIFPSLFFMRSNVYSWLIQRLDRRWPTKGLATST